jgi:PAS domain S-box-containing protein
MKQPLRVLIVDDSERDAELTVMEVTRGGYAVTSARVQTAETMKEALEHATWDLVLSDYSMPTFSGPAALAVLQASGQDVPFIIISGTIGEETAVSALKAGAHDYLLKGRLTRLVPAMERELRDVDARHKHVLLEDKLRLERHNAESAVRHERDLAQRYLDTAAVIMVALDMDGRIALVNRHACSVLGWTAEELLGRDFTDTCVPARLRGETIAQLRIVRSGDDANVENIIVSKSGEERLIEWRTTFLRDEAGHVNGTLSSGTDNTARHQVEEERKKLDQQLRDQQFYTRSLVESNIDALMTTDPRGIITDVNKQTESLTGCTRGELIGAPFKNYFTDSGLAEAGINRVLNEGKVTNYELTARARDGTLTVVSYNATTFYDRDRILQGVFASARDMTEMKRVEHTVQQKEEASRLKSEFLANMSHELRTPLNAVIGFAEVLRDGLAGEMNAQQRRFVGDIFGSAEHLLSLINDILDLSKVEAGRMVLDLEPVPLSSLFMNSLSIIREKAATRQIRVGLEAAEELGSIQADARKVKQIVYNLLSNAVKFATEDSQVVLCAGRVPRTDVGQLSGSWPGRRFPLADNDFAEFLQISVTDRGIGISPEGLECLFEPFSQIDSRQAREFEGTGLGLALVKRLAELHGGAVAVESAVGEGSCFTVWLPLRVPEEERNHVGHGCPELHRSSPPVRSTLRDEVQE